MFKEFKAFAMRGNVIDLAVGVIIGAAFGKVVSSLVDDIIMPPIGRALGHVDFSNLFISLNGTHYDTLTAAKAAANGWTAKGRLYRTEATRSPANENTMGPPVIVSYTLPTGLRGPSATRT